jgi:hypothetical protein
MHRLHPSKSLCGQDTLTETSAMGLHKFHFLNRIMTRSPLLEPFRSQALPARFARSANL